MIIDLAAERSKREQPDPQFVKRDDDGVPMYMFSIGYKMNTKSWTAELWAYDFDDAFARVAAMRESLTVEGKVFSEVPA